MLCFKLSVMIGFLFFVVMGCSPSVNDGFERTKRMELNQGTKSRFNEIQSIGKSVHKFLKAELDNEKIENIFDQLIDAVVLLENYVEGKDRRGGYRPGDLRWFLQTQVLKSRAGKSKLVFRDQLAVEFFNLKASLLGGERDFIAKKEMRNIVDFLKMLKSQALKLNPYMKFYNWKNTEDLFKSNEEVYKELMLAQNQLRSSAKILSDFIYQRRGAKYFFKSFEVLLKEIRIMIGWSSSDVSRSVEDYRALFSTLKQLAVAGDPLSVESREWPVYIQRSVEVYNLFLTYIFTVKEKNKTANDHKYFDQMVKRVFVLVDQFLRQQPGEVLDFKTLYMSIDTAKKMNFLGERIRVSTLKQILPVVVNKLMAVPKLFPVALRPHVNFLSRDHLREAKKEYLEWHRIQEDLNEQVADVVARKENSYKFVSDSFVELDDLKLPMAKFSLLMSRNDPLRRIVTEVRPFYKKGVRHLWVVPKKDLAKYDVEQNYYNLSQMNLFRSLLRVFARGYVNEEERYKGLVGATREELRQAVSDFRSLAQDLRLLHPDAKDPGGRIFMEANLFTFSGDGTNEYDKSRPTKHLLTYQEGLEQLGFVFSAFEIATKSYRELRELCEAGPKDVFDLVTVDYECYRKNMKNLLMKYHEHLPGMHKFMSGLSEENNFSLRGLFVSEVDWKKFSDLLINSVLREENKPHKWIDYTALGKVIMFLHYMESLLVTHDLNVDGVFDKGEVLKAKDKFYGIIKELSKEPICKIKKSYGPKDDPEEMKQEIEDAVSLRFKFLLANRYVPVTWWERNISQYAHGLWSRAWSWEMEVSRYGIAQIFNSIYKFLLSQDAQKKTTKTKLVKEGC